MVAVKKNTKKNAAWSWGPEQAKAYDVLKATLIQAPILAHPDFSRPFIIDSDASQFALGAVCSQLNDENQEHPVAYASRTLTAAERNYSATKREALGVYWAVHRAFHSYTYGATFLLRTDHSALTSIFGHGPAPEPMIAGWQLQMSQYTYTILHRAGNQHSNADGMSRPSKEHLVPAESDPTLTYPDNIMVDMTPMLLVTAGDDPEIPEWQQHLTTPYLAEFPDRDKIILHQSTDPITSEIISYLNDNESIVDTPIRLEAGRCSIIDGILFAWVIEQRGGRVAATVPRLWVPETLRLDILFICHDIPMAGHLDQVRTFHRVMATFWWPKLWRDTGNYVKSCQNCHTRKTPPRQLRNMIHEGFTPQAPFQYVAMDITKVTYPSATTSHVLVFIDLFTRWVETVTFCVTPTAAMVADAFIAAVVARHGIPEFLISDNGTNLNAQLVCDVCLLLNTKNIFVAPYTPQTNGTVERFNKSFKNILAAVMVQKREQWAEYMPQVLLAYRSAFHASLMDSPFFLLYGRDPRFVPSLVNPDLFSLSSAEARAKLLDQMEFARSIVRITLKASSLKSRATFNKNLKPEAPLVGLVYRRIPENEVDFTLPPKARPAWDGPFRVLRSTTPVSYDIQKVGSNSTVKAHRKDLKQYFPDDALNRLTLTPVEGPTLLEVEFIRDHKIDKISKQMSFKVRWRSLLAPDDTWESYYTLTESAPAIVADYLQKLVLKTATDKSNVPRVH